MYPKPQIILDTANEVLELLKSKGMTVEEINNVLMEVSWNFSGYLREERNMLDQTIFK